MPEPEHDDYVTLDLAALATLRDAVQAVTGCQQRHCGPRCRRGRLLEDEPTRQLLAALRAALEVGDGPLVALGMLDGLLEHGATPESATAILRGWWAARQEGVGMDPARLAAKLAATHRPG